MYLADLLGIASLVFISWVSKRSMQCIRMAGCFIDDQQLVNLFQNNNSNSGIMCSTNSSVELERGRTNSLPVAGGFPFSDRNKMAGSHVLVST